MLSILFQIWNFYYQWNINEIKILKYERSDKNMNEKTKFKFLRRQFWITMTQKRLKKIVDE